MEENIKEIIELHKSRVYIIDEILLSEDKFYEVKEEIYSFFKQGFEIKELRECPAKFTFSSHAGNKVHTLQLRHLYTHLCMWYPFVMLGEPLLDETYILENPFEVTSGVIENFINNKIIRPFAEEVDNELMNMALHDMMMNLAEISTDFNEILGLSINMESFYALYDRNEEFRDILHTKVDENDQPSEIESFVDGKLKKLMNILKTEETTLLPVLHAGSGIKPKQLQEFFINIALRPNTDGMTIPIPINTNLVMGGLNSVANYYLETNSSRKSLLANKFEIDYSLSA